MKYINRQIEPKIKKLLKSFPSVVVTGPRQSGKSTLLINILKDYNYITLDDPLKREQAISDPLFFLESAGEKAIIDEIQYAPQLLSYIKIKIDRNREKKGLYVFTGSQQFNLIKDIGDTLAGRIGLLDLLPFSVSEKKSCIQMGSAIDYFIHAALVGSYPELVLDKRIDIPAWYGAYMQTYLERDIRGIYNIGNLRDFQRFVRLISGRCAQVLNISDFAKDIGVSVPTIKNWLSVLEASRIIYLLPPYYNNFGKRIIKAPKLYFLDIGLVCYLTGISDSKHLLQGPMAGALFENFCIQETIKLLFNHGLIPQLYYLRTSNNLEVDLLIEGPARTIFPIEINLNKTPALHMGSKISRFKKLFSTLNIGECFIFSLTEKTIHLSSDITAVTFDDYINWLYNNLL